MFSFTNVLLCLFPRAVLNRLCEVRRLDFVAVREVGNRAREFEDAMVRARTHLHLLHRRTQQILTRVVDCAVLSHLCGSHIRVHLPIRPGEALALTFARAFHAFANLS